MDKTIGCQHRADTLSPYPRMEKKDKKDKNKIKAHDTMLILIISQSIWCHCRSGKD